jgi:hypothetical protein
MKRIIFFFVTFSIFCCTQLIAQQNNAADYWKMEHDPVFNGYKQRKDAGESLSEKEQRFLVEYQSKLDEYFGKMSDNEKSIYYKNRVKWTEQPETINKNEGQQEAEVYAGEKSTYTQYLVSSGTFGFIYGWTSIGIFGLGDTEGAAGIPFLTAGASTLIPILTIKNRNVTYNSLKLSLHGKTMGFFDGAALALLITGKNIDDEGKLFLTLSTLSSIGLGRLGYALGRNNSWSPGRVALYSHYGGLMPLEGLALDAAFKVDDPRIYAATFLVFGAGGYYIADRVARWNDFTKGDIISTQALTSLNAMLGYGLMIDSNIDSDITPAEFLLPALGALGGTIAAHYWLKDARFTNQQGRNTALAASGGAVFGLGLAALITPNSTTPYYLFPYITGMTTYSILVNKYKKTNNNLASFEKEKTHRWQVNFMPQNIILNQKLGNNTSFQPGRQQVFLPAFSASLRF